MQNIVIDLETTANGPKHNPEAHYPQNKVIMCGWKILPHGSVYIHKQVEELLDYIEERIKDKAPVRLIGHNIKFDLKYLMRERPDLQWPMVDVWDTQHVEYRLSGHQSRMVSLEGLAARHGIAKQKTLDLGALIKAGIMPEDVPEDEMQEYLEGDIGLTEMIWHEQQSVPYCEHIFQNHLLVLAEMELNGLPIDKGELVTASRLAYASADLSEDSIWELIRDNLEWTNGDEITEKHIKPTAPRTISHLLTGEPQQLTKHKTKQIVWKKGKKPLLTQSQISKIWGSAEPTHLGYPMSKYEMEDIITYSTGEASDLMQWLTDFRHWSKLTGTYYGPFAEDMAASGLDTIHPKINASVTGTGRNSSSNPNGQNMPHDARALVHSTQGKLCEIDFKQLEVAALAVLSKDKQLTKDISNGEDIHYNTGRKVMGWTKPSDMNKDDRKIVKNVNFGLIYGGGATGLAHQTGQSKKLVASLIHSFYARYPGVKDWQKDVYTKVVQNMKPAGHKNGEAFYSSIYQCPVSDRRYYFEEGQAPGWVRAKTGRMFSFKPTETKNYPVQGFAGGDLVMIAMWHLWSVLHYGKTKFRMTVHDSILIDTPLSEQAIIGVMSEACEQVERQFNIPFPLSFELEMGTQWS